MFPFIILSMFLGGSRAPYISDPGDSALVLLSYRRLLAVAAGPKDCQWPPEIRLVDDTLVQATAFAVRAEGTGVIVPCVTIHAGIFARLLRGNPDAVAFVLAHELAHIMLRHVIVRPQSVRTEFVKASYSREQEIEADGAGMKLALAAGFSRGTILKGMRRFADDPRCEYSLYESLQGRHPTWKERIAVLDTLQAPIWKSMSAFENGTFFLATEQYPAAERCFRGVTEEFPACPEAWANLGCALLMQYCDALEPSDLKDFGIGHLMVGGFYRRAESLEQRLRGVNEDLWWDAVEALEKALRLKEDLALAKANLGIACLVRPGGREAGKAAKYFAEALESTPVADDADPRARYALLINAGVAEIGLGNPARSEQFFTRAEGMMRTFAPERRRRTAINPHPALLYNRALLLDEPGGDAERSRRAEELYLRFLQTAPPASLWWDEAYERYARLRRESRTDPREKEELRMTASAGYRTTAGIALGGGKSVFLTEPVREVAKRLGAADPLPVAARTNLVKLLYPSLGIAILAADRVLAIFSKGNRAPPVALGAAGLGGRKSELRVGMKTEDVDRLLAPGSSEIVDLLGDGEEYRFYRAAGIALKMRLEKIEELVIVQIPMKSR